MKMHISLHRLGYKNVEYILIVFLLAVMFVVAPRIDAQAATIRWVTSTADSGSGTLREALQNAQAGDTILFSNSVFPTVNPATIYLSSELPTLTGSNVTLDGSEAGVIINGGNLPQGHDCLIIQNASNVIVRGLQFISCKDSAIDIRSNVGGLTIGGNRSAGSGPVGQGNRFSLNQRAVWADADNLSNFSLKGNLVGVDLSGVSASGNTVSGVTLKRVTGLTIGGSAEGERNIFSGNAIYGVEIWQSAPILIENNYIGTNFQGNSAIGNGDIGVIIINSDQLVFNNNLVSGNATNGAFFENVNHIVAQGNTIGTDLTGNSAIPNGHVGMVMIGRDITVGGSAPGLGNLISGNSGWTGLEIKNDSSDPASAVIQGNLIGVNRAGTAAIPNNTAGIYVGGANLLLGGYNPGEGNLIAGNGGAGLTVEFRSTPGVTVEMVGNTFGANLEGNAILSNLGYGAFINGVTQATIKNNLVVGSGTNGWAGIHVEGNGAQDSWAVIQNNLIGVDRGGSFALPNEKLGLYGKNLNMTIGGYGAHEGNVISGNKSSGIELQNSTQFSYSATIIGNYIGTDITGSQKIGNLQNGAYIHRMGSVLIERNVISNNGENGINIDGELFTSTKICDNKIGTDATGSVDFGNGGNGVWAQYTNLVIGDGQTCLPNLISGNEAAGIATRGSGMLWTTIRGNKIGTDSTGQFSLGQSGDGVWSEGYNLVFGGPNPEDSNLVSGNLHTGLVVKGSTSATIQNNFFGVNLSGNLRLQNGWNGVVLNNTQNAQVFDNLISGSVYNGIALETGAHNNSIYGNYIGTDILGNSSIGNLDRGMIISGGASNNQVFDNLISGNHFGIVMADIGTDQNLIFGNLIGVDVTGTKVLSNQSTGIIVDRGAYNVIGGDDPTERNVISGNLEHGITISNSEAVHNIVMGNYIGVDISGTIPLGNEKVGIGIYNGASWNQVGGQTAAERNIISANQEHGVAIGGVGNRLENNYIGTDVTGTISMGNSNEGVVIHVPDIGDQGQNHVVNNLISGNGTNGMVIYGDNNIIQGNFIGVNVTGDQPLSNVTHGLYVSGTGNLIGGETQAQRNIISGNGYNGIQLGIDRRLDNTIIRKATSNTIQGNYLGTDIGGLQPIPNGWAGVFVSGQSNLIGGSYGTQGNLISGNSHEGLILGEASLTTSNLIQGNRIGTDHTGQLALANGDSGVTIWGGVGNNTIGGNTPDKGNVVAFNHDLGIAKWKDSINGEGTGNLIAYNQIHHNEGVGLRITVNTSLTNNNVYENGENRIEVPAGTIQGANQTWAVQGQANTYFVHYDCIDCDLVVAAGRTLTLAKGVHVYLDYNRTLKVQGKLVAEGTLSSPVRITGPRDSIWAGDWKGIVFTAGSQGVLNYSEVSFAQIGLDISGAVNLSNSIISGHRIGGIRVLSSGTLQLSNNTFSANFSDTYNPANNAYDIRNDSTTQINARGSWWGRVSGPVSQKIIGSVDASNWRTVEGTTDLWQSAELVTEGAHEFRVSDSNDLDWFRIPIMEGNRTLNITVENLPVDYDVFLFGQLGGMVKQTEGIARRIRHIARMMDSEETQAVDQLDDIARVMHIGQYSSDVEGLDTGLDTGQLLRASTNPGFKSEEVAFDVGNQVGWYYFLIAGNNGAHSDQTYRIRISTTYQDDLGPENYYVPVFPPMRGVSSKKTLILWNSAHMEELYGQAAVDEINDKALILASHPQVDADIVDVSNCNSLYPDWTGCNQVVQTIYDEWNLNPESVYHANRVAATIKSLIGSIRTSYPELKYLVFLGNDSMMPHWRVMDEAPLANEATYPASFLPNRPIAAALSQGYFLTDDYFSSFEPIAWHGRELYLPFYATGRLVETPSQIITMIDAFLAVPQKSIDTALVTGYDFLQDQATAISNEFQPVATQTLINDTWTTAELTNAWFTGSPADFVSLNAHFTHWQATPGSLDDLNPFLPSMIQTDLHNAAGSLVYSVGCHSGLSIPDSQPRQNYEMDFAQVFAEKGITYIGNTGFGYGDRASVGYSEVVSLTFMKELRNTPGVGDALVLAKNQYFQKTGVYSFSPYDEKSLEETILYGLPMQEYNIPAPAKNLSAFADAIEPCQVQTTSGPSGLTAQQVTCTLSPLQVSNEQGEYFSINGETEVNIGQPVQPRIGTRITLPGTTAHGAFLESGSYLTLLDFDPVITNVVTDGVSGDPNEPAFLRQAWTPSSWDIINSIRVTDGIEQKLVLIPAQYRSTTSTTGVERVFTNLTYTIYYSESLDSLPPFVWAVDVDSQLFAPTGSVVVTAFDRSGIARVAATYTRDDGTWITVELSSTDGTHWSGMLPTEGDFFVQVVDFAGNIAIADAKGGYYSFLNHGLFLPLIRR